MTTSASILWQIEQILKNAAPEKVEALANELAKIVPAKPNATIEWQKRLHYQDDGTILAGAYLRVFPAQQHQGNTDILEIVKSLF